MRQESQNNMTNSENVEVIVTKIDYIQRDITQIRSRLEAEYVTRDQFDPIKKIVYGMVSLVLVAVVGALVSLIIRK